MGRETCVDCGLERDDRALSLLRRWDAIRPGWILRIESEPTRCYRCWEYYYAEYMLAGFSLQDSGVWEEVCGPVEVAVIWRDAGFTLSDISDWRAYFAQSNVAASWRRFGFRANEAERWARLCDKAEDAAVWRVAGFTSDLDPSWIEWGLSAGEVIDCIDSVNELSGEIDYPWFSEKCAPDINYRDDWGLGFNEAVFCWKNALFASFDYTFRAPRFSQSLEYWMTTGLSLSEVVELKNAISSSDEIEIHFELQDKIKDWKPDVYEFLPKVWGELRKAGVPVTHENLIKYWGLSKSQILKSIDMGTDVKFAVNLVRSGIPVSKLKIMEHLIANGVDKDSAIQLTKAGFSMGVIKQIEKAGYSIDDIVGVVAEHKGLKAAEIKKWLLVDTGYAKWTWANQIAEWQKCGFSSGEAAEWFREGFKAKDAKLWVESGAMTPAIAKRRKAAGISPKTVS